MSVRNYHYPLRKNPELSGSHYSFLLPVTEFFCQLPWFHNVDGRWMKYEHAILMDICWLETTEFFLPWRHSPSGPRPPHYGGFTITLRHTTLGRTALDESSDRRRDLYLTHNIHNRQTSKPSAGFEPTILAIERRQNHALDRAAIGIGRQPNYYV